MIQWNDTYYTCVSHLNLNLHVFNEQWLFLARSLFPISQFMCVCVSFSLACSSGSLFIFVKINKSNLHEWQLYPILYSSKMEKNQNEQQQQHQKKTILCVCSHGMSVVNLVHTHKVPQQSHKYTHDLLILETHIRVKTNLVPLKFNRCLQ